MIKNKRNKFSILASFTLLLIVLCTPAQASLMFAGLDLNEFDFDVLEYDTGGGNGLDGNATASGTSNGVSWDIGPTNLWTGRTEIDGIFNFINSGANILGKSTDNLHTSSDFTVTFDRVVETLYVALGNDNGTDSINLGLAPQEVQGIVVSGNQLSLADGAQAGLAKFTNISSLTVSHTNINTFDGFDFAFHAVASKVSAPSVLAIFALSLLGFGLTKKTRV